LKFKFDLKNKLDLSIAVAGIILFTTGAFLRFFKYFFTPLMLEKLTLILIPEFLVFVILIAIKLFKGI